jgi:hypothetical protein
VAVLNVSDTCRPLCVNSNKEDFMALTRKDNKET